MQSLTESVPFYGARGSPDFLEEVAAHMEAHIRNFVAISKEDRSPRRDDVEFMRDTIVRRVHQGFPLEGVLHAVRVGHRELWQAIVAHGESMAVDHELIFELTRRTFEYVDAVGVEMTRIYLAEQQRLASKSERERRDVLEDLLARRLPLPDNAAARSVASIDKGNGVTVVVGYLADTADTRLPDPLRQAADALAKEVGLLADDSFIVLRHQELVGLLPIPAAGIAAHCGRIREVQQSLEMSRSIPLAIGVSAACTSLEDFARGYEQAVDAMRSTGGLPGVVAVPEMSLFDYLVARADPGARELAAAEIGRLSADGVRGGSVLIETLLAYVAADLNVTNAAAALFVHPNTVHYRLARLAEVTGRDTRSFKDVVELLAAVRLAATD